MKKQVLSQIFITGLFLVMVFFINSCKTAKVQQEEGVIKREFLDGEVSVVKEEIKNTLEQAGELGSRVLSEGMTGRDVGILQERLRLAGFVDYQFEPGVFDSLTKRAVQEYQKTSRPYLREVLKFTPEDRFSPDGVVSLELCKHLIKKTGYYSKLVSYVVKPGDTLSDISKKFKVPLSELILLNNLNKKNHFIREGQKVFIILRPESNRERLYKVQEGDELKKIAEKFQIPVEDLIKANCLFTSSLKTGDLLYIPAPLEESKQF